MDDRDHEMFLLNIQKKSINISLQDKKKLSYSYSSRIWIHDLLLTQVVDATPGQVYHINHSATDVTMFHKHRYYCNSQIPIEFPEQRVPGKGYKFRPW